MIKNPYLITKLNVNTKFHKLNQSIKITSHENHLSRNYIQLIQKINYMNYPTPLE